jgi:prepilin-type N-terminal cleavage/methylation domain-containing protein
MGKQHERLTEMKNNGILSSYSREGVHLHRLPPSLPPAGTESARGGAESAPALFIRPCAGKGPRGRRGGFTLVEVIVVLVILAILAAIAIPTLTGYIDRAREKQYITRARDASIALRAVMDEAWANGELNTKFRDFIGQDMLGLKLFEVSYLSENSYSGSDSWTRLFQRTAALLGEEYNASSAAPGYWEINLVAAKGSDATAVTADGFWLELFPEGVTTGKPAICVTYRLSHVDGLEGRGYDADFWGAINDGSFTYDAQAGYEVYHLVY